MAMTLRSFRAFEKNTLRGFAEIELSSGLIIHDIAIHSKSGKSWASFLSIPQMENGHHRVVDGKTQYKRIIEWRSRELSDEFSEAVVNLVSSQYPQALGRNNE